MVAHNCTCVCEREPDGEDMLSGRPQKSLIEEERQRLMQASSVLACLAIGLAEVDGIILEHGDPDFSIVAEAARGLIEEAIVNLDSVSLKTALRAKVDPEEEEDDDGPDEQAQGPPSPD